MLRGEGNAEEGSKTPIGLMSKKGGPIAQAQQSETIYPLLGFVRRFDSCLIEHRQKHQQKIRCLMLASQWYNMHVCSYISVCINTNHVSKVKSMFQSHTIT